MAFVGVIINQTAIYRIQAKIRPRFLYVLGMTVAFALGVGSRGESPWIPAIIVSYAGDTCYALFLYMLLRFLLPSSPRYAAFLGAFGISVVVEFSQLAHPHWLEVMRSFFLGELLLGTDFLVSDLFCYLGGSLIGYIAEYFLNRPVSQIKRIN